MRVSVLDAAAALNPSFELFGFLALSKAGKWDQWMDRTRSLLTLQVAL